MKGLVATGRVPSWQGGSVWIGQGRGSSQWHSHHAHQVALALDGEVRFRTDRKAPWTAYSAAIVPSHCPHEFEIDGATVAHLFVEPESRPGRALSAQCSRSAVCVPPEAVARAPATRLLAALRANVDAESMKAQARADLSRGNFERAL